MKVLCEQLIIHLKSRFFDLIGSKNDLLQYDQFIKELIFSVKKFLDVDEVSLFTFNEWKQNLYIEACTRDESIASQRLPFISKELFETHIATTPFLYYPFPIEILNDYDLILPLQNLEARPGFLAIKGNSEQNWDEKILNYLASELGKCIYKSQEIRDTIFEENRYKQLFRVTEKFHSTMDMDAVLEEIIFTLQEVYPTFNYFLMLSHDNNSHANLPIKDLEYDSENITAMQAYVTGQIQLEDLVHEKQSILYAPLKGKQGVYGVLQVIAPNTMTFPEAEIEFMSLLANTAGSAIENAQLYQQSRRLISDLQLINETSHRLNSDLRLSETTSFMADQIVKSFGAEEAGFISVAEGSEQPTVFPGSTTFFFSDEINTYLQYFIDKFNEDPESLFIGDLRMGDLELPYRSIMAIPMVQGGVMQGFVLALHHEPYHFSFESFKLLQSLVHHSTLAFTNSILREELEKMVITDHLTKLYSRSYLDKKITRSMIEDGYGAFILIDLDDFKQINDTFGHQIGDEVLVQVAEIIRDNIRETDIGARWGGEELAIYLPKVSAEIAVQVAKRLVNKIREETEPQITVSCGISFWSKEYEDNYNRLFKRADKALYIAKETGKNKVIIQDYTEAIH